MAERRRAARALPPAWQRALRQAGNGTGAATLKLVERAVRDRQLLSGLRCEAVLEELRRRLPVIPPEVEKAIPRLMVEVVDQGRDLYHGALLALVSGGLQRGHMKLHAARLAYQAGARGAEVRAVAERMADSQSYRQDDAAAALAALRENNG